MNCYARTALTGVWVMTVGSTSPLDAQDGALLEEELLSLASIASGLEPQVESYRLVYSSDGLRVVGFLVRPKHPSARLPILIYNRGGNREFGKITASLIEGELAPLAARGYVVLASQYRGNDGGEGREEFGGEDVHDVLNLIVLARRLPYVDPDQIVMLGESRGGLMTYLAIKSGAPLKAAAVVSAPSDLAESHHERESMAEVLDELIGGTPDEKELDYRERSAYFWPEKLTVPLLILHGGKDWRVPCSHSQKLAERLDSLHLSHQLVVFPEGSHGLEDFAQERNQLIAAWFEKHLQAPVHLVDRAR